MCGRYNIRPGAVAWLEGLGIAANLLREMGPRYNVAPGQDLPVVRPGEAEPELAQMRWGFVPHWMRDPDPKAWPINARAETAADKRYFRDAMKKSHCLIPATGFYEWQSVKGSRKQPWHIHRKGGEPFFMAGLWSEWTAGREGPVNTFAILTTDANELVTAIHNRMPVILTPEEAFNWLAHKPDVSLDPCPSEELEAERISTKVNDPSNDTEDVLEPCE